VRTTAGRGGCQHLYGALVAHLSPGKGGPTIAPGGPPMFGAFHPVCSRSGREWLETGKFIPRGTIPGSPWAAVCGQLSLF